MQGGLLQKLDAMGGDLKIQAVNKCISNNFIQYFWE